MQLKSVYDWCSMIIKNDALKSFLCTILQIILNVFNLSNNIIVIQVDTLNDWLFDWLMFKAASSIFQPLVASRQEISRSASYLKNMLRNCEIYIFAKRSGNIMIRVSAILFYYFPDFWDSCLACYSQRSAKFCFVLEWLSTVMKKKFPTNCLIRFVIVLYYNSHYTSNSSEYKWNRLLCLVECNLHKHSPNFTPLISKVRETFVRQKSVKQHYENIWRHYPFQEILCEKQIYELEIKLLLRNFDQN